MSAKREDAEGNVLLSKIWQERGISLEGMSPDSHGTFGRHVSSLVAATTETLAAWEHTRLLGTSETISEVSGAVDVERMAPQARTANIENSVQIGEVLGRGGMGEVRIAEQSSLQRQVAVKLLKEGSHAPAMVTSLLREAWIGGSLEHPSIVPVHMLGQDGDSPLLVMKRVEGRSWAESLDEYGDRALDDDELEHELDILTKVCHAVHFAHSKGIVHLDLKPDNVMLGEFGEVYLVDWGLAATFLNDQPAWMPRCADICGVLGTPSYLSPEQAAGEGERFGVHTDVYLLGAILHRIVQGDVLHNADTVMAAIVSAFKSEPRKYREQVAPELVAIIHRATHREPDKRFQTVKAFRQALEDFLRHRSSNQLVREALSRLERVRPFLSTDASQSMSHVEMLGAVEIQRDATECRFGLQQALRIWPDNREATAGLNELLELMVKRAISERDWRVAATTLNEMPDPPITLAAEIDELRLSLKDERDEVRALKDLQREVDLETHRLVRKRFVFWGGLCWLVWNLGAGWLNRSQPFNYTQLLGGSFGSLLVYIISAYVVRNTLFKTRINRYALVLMGSGMASTGFLWLLCSMMGIPLMTAIALSLPMYLFFFAAVILTIDKRTIWILPAGLALSMLAPFYTAWAFEIAAVLGALACWSFAWIWRKPG